MMMAQPVKPSKLAPIVPPRRKSSLFMRAKSNHDMLELLACRHLIVTTTRGVFTWGSHGVKEIFHSGSGGIVAARKARNGSSLLAVADSQVVILHDTRKGMQKSYNLRGSDGELRLLRYSGDSKSLFFTTTLQNAVQTYSLHESRLLDPSHNHPSPPTVFAISSNFHLLLSASAFPPTIHLTNLLFNTPPTLIRPQCSQSAVTTAAFHPERPNVFLLAFADGACATYDATSLFQDGGRGERRLGPASSGAKAETMFIKNVHTMNNIVTDSVLKETQGYDASNGTAVIGHKSLAITAAAFVPGYRSRFFTVGQDGKCCVIDLAAPGKKEARVVDSWHVRSPATSLSVTLFNHDHGVFGHNVIQAPEDAKNAVNGKPLIAVGCQDSRVLLFDLRGHQLGGETFHPFGTRVVDVEWMSGEDTTRRKGSKSGHGIPQTPLVKAKRTGVGSVLGRDRAGTEEVISIMMDGTDEMVFVPPRNSSVSENTAKEPSVQRDVAATALNHMDPFSPIILSDPKDRKRRMSGKHERESEDSETTIKATRRPGPRIANDALTDTQKQHFGEEQPPKSSVKRDLAPPIPRRPAPRKRNDISAPRAETTTDPMNSQSTTIDASSPTRGLGLLAPYMKPNIIVVQAKPGNPKNTASPDKSNAQNAASAEAIDEDLWTDIAPESRQATDTAPRKALTKRSRSHNKSITRPPPADPSEASNDTVIDWAPASSRPPNPLLLPPLSNTYKKPSRKFKKGHVSLSRSSTSDETMVQWSSFKKRSGLDIHNDRPDSTTQLPSSHPSPTKVNDVAPMKPLTETTHNPKVNPTSSLSQMQTATAPASLFPTPQSQAEQMHHNPDLQQTNNTHPACADEPPTSPSPQVEPPRSMTLFSSVLRRELQALRADVREDLARQLAVQRSWFDAQLVASRDERRVLVEENRMLREMLVVERRTRGSGGRDEIHSGESER